MTSGSNALATAEAEAIELLRGDKDLAGGINAEHGLVETYKHNTIRHGELPREMKRRAGHSNRPARAREHFGTSGRTARNHKIAKSAPGEELDDRRAGEALYAASREAHQVAIDPSLKEGACGVRWVNIQKKVYSCI